MLNLIPGNQKHLTPADRQFIEESLNSQRSFRDIAKYLCKDPSTISKEVFRHHISNTWNRSSFNNPYNFCVRRHKCRKQNACRKLVICDTLCRSCHICNNVCPGFEREFCSRIARAPYVCCNGCNKPRHLCTIQAKYNYNATTHTAGGLFVLQSSVFRISEKRNFGEQSHALTIKKV